MFTSSPPPPNELTVNLLVAFGLLLILILCAAFIGWPDPKTARKSKKKLTGYVQTIEKESIDKESRLKDLKIRDWNPFIKEERIIESPTYDNVLRRRPHITFKAKSPIQGESKEIVSSFTHKDGDTWVMDDVYRGWNGDPVNAEWEKRLNSIIHIVPSDRDYSFTTTEIWHYRLCDKKQLKEEGKDHEHTGICELVNSVKHVTWHIKAKG